MLDKCNTNFRDIFDKWNRILDSTKLAGEVEFWEKGIEQGVFPEFYSEDDFDSFTDYLKYYEVRKEMTMSKKDLQIILGASENRIIDDFETGEITIHAKSEADLQKAYQHLVNRGIINE